MSYSSLPSNKLLGYCQSLLAELKNLHIAFTIEDVE
jgi:hypothetical protein